MAYKRTARKTKTRTRSIPGTPSPNSVKPRTTGTAPNPSARARLRASANARFNRGTAAPTVAPRTGGRANPATAAAKRASMVTKLGAIKPATKSTRLRNAKFRRS